MHEPLSRDPFWERIEEPGIDSCVTDVTRGSGPLSASSWEIALVHDVEDGIHVCDLTCLDWIISTMKLLPDLHEQVLRITVSGILPHEKLGDDKPMEEAATTQAPKYRRYTYASPLFDYRKNLRATARSSPPAPSLKQNFSYVTSPFWGSGHQAQIVFVLNRAFEARLDPEPDEEL
jgi:hypothetical protein